MRSTIDREEGILANLPAVIGDLPAARVSFVLFLLAGVMGVILAYQAHLSAIYLLVMFGAFAAVCRLYLKLLERADHEVAQQVFVCSWFYFVIGTNVGIVLDRTVATVAQGF